MCSCETKITLRKLFISLRNPELNMYFTVHKIDSNILSRDVPMKFLTSSESQIPFRQQMTTGPLPSAAASFPCAYLMWWKCVSEWSQFCDKPQISDAIKSFYLEFFMINV